ncbi:hypothetical protein Pcinc_044270 [Petrolisthes cinctipes]|uniref:Uncharacterized protein n=1 Tax=Petrolisthes cinctipes TaxID=88211 RepID=A0AAE1BEH2_PETCI|nr:hypothetical protein Pcinc_044270 [Petrolisthes cinctipes]
MRLIVLSPPHPLLPHPSPLLPRTPLPPSFLTLHLSPPSSNTSTPSSSPPPLLPRIPLPPTLLSPLLLSSPLTPPFSNTSTPLLPHPSPLPSFLEYLYPLLPSSPHLSSVPHQHHP